MEKFSIRPESDLYILWHTLRKAQVQIKDGLLIIDEVVSQERQELSDQEDEALREIVRRTSCDLNYIYEQMKHSGARRVINNFLNKK